MKKRRVVIAVSDETHRKMKEIKLRTERSLMWVVNRAVNNYYNAITRNTTAKAQNENQPKTPKTI